MSLLILLMVATLDTSPRSAPALKPVELGGNWTAHEKFKDRGLDVQKFTNNHLKRTEIWHYSPDGRWWILACRNVFVLGVRRANNTWTTDPRTRLVRHRNRWHRATQAEKR